MAHGRPRAQGRLARVMTGFSSVDWGSAPSRRPSDPPLPLSQAIFFPARERARMYGDIISLAAASGAESVRARGYPVSGVASWRWAFGSSRRWQPCRALTIVRKSPEPTCGTQAGLDPRQAEGQAQKLVREAILADRRQRRAENTSMKTPMRMPLRRAGRLTCLPSAATDCSSSFGDIGYFFLAGVQTFGWSSSAETSNSARPRPSRSSASSGSAQRRRARRRAPADKLISRGELDARNSRRRVRALFVRRGGASRRLLSRPRPGLSPPAT